ncbi:uncharacterized protein [Miscanthus floridulus]|uniref:uncharacterized protein n=1 Tax=Miscanthus floridulus TaxID=154761 RepID=UPI00345A0D32
MEEEDDVKEIECEGSRPQAICILCKRGVEVVVMEEEDTTREVKMLRSTLSIAMKQIEQLIKRMEPLAEENEKLKEAMKLMAKNLEHAFDQLGRTFKLLKTISEQKKEQDAELGQLRQVIDQLQEEKEKAFGRAEKLTKDLEEYRRRTKVQFDVLELEAKIQRGKLDAVVARVRLVLDCIDMEVAR